MQVGLAASSVIVKRIFLPGSKMGSPFRDLHVHNALLLQATFYLGNWKRYVYNCLRIDLPYFKHSDSSDHLGDHSNGQDID